MSEDSWLMQVESNDFILPHLQMAIIFAKILEQPVKCNFGKCQNLTCNRRWRIERKHEIDERASNIMIISGLSVFRSSQFVLKIL